VAPELLKLI